MKIGALQKFSMIDYEGKLSAIVFTQGCNFRCPYCHNPELVKPEKYQTPVPMEIVFSFLENRIGLLDAVVITGGEPTLHRDLHVFIKRIKDLGFLVKLDTNGTNPDVLEHLVKNDLVDYLAMDIKAPLSKYSQVTRCAVDISKISRSIELIKTSGVEHEFRSTLVKNLLTEDEILDIGNLLGKKTRYFLQNFVPAKTVNEKFMQAVPLPLERINILLDKFHLNYSEVYVR
ncbi:MAG: anaerobic ribonucleoside-triphosphate reductase activating protein [Candidatus Cloacimonas sp. SDB]|nr:MAG: anaerobic ribonucleoside-triphosphate reductase activating protein [Candidatus Cloacimonas sp. SDB]